MAERPEIRKDFIQRLFTVAISVGFATTVASLHFIGAATWPDPAEQIQIAILFVGLYATVLSWDGYLVSISDKKLKGTTRFTIDIILVFVYMLLLISSKQPQFWLPLLAFVFFLYTVWDAFTISEHMAQYDSSLVRPNGAAGTIGDVVKVYWRSALDRPGTRRGAIITLVWATYFFGLFLLYMQQKFKDPPDERLEVFVTCLFAIAGLTFYRLDKKHQYSMKWRVALGALLFLGALAFFSLK